MSTLRNAASEAPINTALPVITGESEIDSVLTGSDGTWLNSPTSYTYQWNRDGIAIPGETSNQYTRTFGDIGTYISITVTATNAAGSDFATSLGFLVSISPLITSGDLDILNRYIDVSFYPDAYHSAGGGVQAGDLQVVFVQNGGTATAAAISSVTKIDGTPLDGGENTIRVHLSITGSASGVETIEIKPSAAGSIEDGDGNPCPAQTSTGAIPLEVELDPAYKAGILAALNNDIEVPIRAQRLVDNDLFIELRSIGALAEMDVLRFFHVNNDFPTIDFIAGYLQGEKVGTPETIPFVGTRTNIPGNNSYYKLGWIPYSQSVKFQQNDASFGLCIAENIQSQATILGGRGHSTLGINIGHIRFVPRSTADQLVGGLNYNASGNSFVEPNTDSSGRWHISREASNLTRVYRNAVQVDSATTASSALTDQDLYILSSNVNGVASAGAPHLVRCVFFGSGMQDIKDDLDTAFATWGSATTALIPSYSGRLYAIIGQSNIDRSGPLSDLPSYLNNGPYSIANGYPANVRVWWKDEWQFLEPGVNGVDKTGNIWAGPIFSFAYEESLKHPGEDLFIIHQAIGGTGLYTNWMPGLNQHVKFMAEYHNAIAAMDEVTSYEAILWGQGENEAYQTSTLALAEGYEAAEEELFDDLFANTGFTRAIVMNISSDLNNGNFPYKAQVRTSKTNNLANGVYGVDGAIVSIDDLEKREGDSVHMTTASGVIFGQRLSAAIPVPTP